MPSLSTDFIRKLLPYKEINVVSESRPGSKIYHLPHGPCAEIILKDHFDKLISRGVKLSDIYVSNIIGFDKRCEIFSIEYDLISQIIESDLNTTIKPFTPGRRVITIDKKDGEISIVNDPTVEELIETIKIVASEWFKERKENFHRIMDESAIAASEEHHKEVASIMKSNDKIDKWDTVKKEFGIVDKPKVFPNDGTAYEIISHRTNGLNKNIRIFSLDDQKVTNEIVPTNDYMILLPFEYRKKDVKKILFDVSDGTWKIFKQSRLDDRKLQVIWYNNELIGIITVNNSLTFYKAHNISFQHGQMKTSGIVGITNEVLLAILINRFKSSGITFDDNSVIRNFLENARLWIHKRTLDKNICDEYANENKSGVKTLGKCPCSTMHPDMYKEWVEKYGECGCKYVRKLKIGDKYRRDTKCVWEIISFGVAYDGYTPTYEVTNGDVKGTEYAKDIDKLCGKI